MEETKAQPVEVGEVETQLLPKIVGEAGVLYIYIYIYIFL